MHHIKLQKGIIMKKILLLLLLLTYGLSQSQDFSLTKSIDGELVSINKLYNSKTEDLFGYLVLNDLGYVTETSRKYEYTILDSNFNKLQNGTFTDNFYHKYLKEKIKTSVKDIAYSKNQILIYYGYYIEDYSKGTFSNKFRVIDLEKNNSRGPYTLDGNKLRPELEISGKEELKAFQKRDKEEYKSINYNWINLKSYSDKGFILQEITSSMYRTSVTSQISLLNLDQEFLFIKTMPDGYTNIIDYDDKNFYLTSSSSLAVNDFSIYSRYYSAIDKGGKDIYKMEYKSTLYDYFPTTIKVIDKKIYILGSYRLKKGEDYKNLGIYRRILNLEDGKEISLDHIKNTELKSDKEISEFGKVDNLGQLQFEYFSITDIGEIIAVAETYKEYSKSNIYTDLAYFKISADFKSISSEFYALGKTKISKFSYAQQLPNKEGVVMTFINKDDNKNWVLNTLAYNYATQKITKSDLSLEKKGSNVVFSSAKKGYLTLIEYFKNQKPGDKEVEIRLEKINY